MARARRGIAGSDGAVGRRVGIIARSATAFARTCSVTICLFVLFRDLLYTVEARIARGR
jgi:hypothetical protein